MNRWMKARVLAAVAAAGVTALVLAGCSGGAAPAAKPTATAAVTKCARPASITIWALLNSQAQADLDASLVKSYQDQCPGTSINYQYIAGGSMNTKITTALASDNPPTVIEPTASAAMAPYAKNGALVDLTKALKSTNPNWASSFVPASLKDSTFDGDVYGVPYFGAQPTALWYNKTVFKNAGIKNPPKTLAELTADVEKFKAKGIIPIALGDQDKYPSTYVGQYLVEREGGTAPFKGVLDGKANAWSNPSIMAGLKQLATLSANGAFGSGFDSTGDQNGADRALFASGKAAMMVATASFLSKLTSVYPALVQSGVVGYTQFPSGKQKTNTVDGSAASTMFVTAKSSAAQKKLAVSYLTTMLASKSYGTTQAKNGIAPAIAGLGNSFPSTIPGNAAKFAYGLSEQGAMQDPWASLLGTNNTVEQEQMASVISRTSTPQEFAAAMNKAMSLDK